MSKRLRGVPKLAPVLAPVLVVVLLLASPAPASASGGMGWAFGEEILLLLFGVPLVEVAIPDTRVEIDGEGAVVADLSWPLVLTLVRVGDFDGPLVAFGRACSEAHHTTSGVTRGVFTGRVDVLLPFDAGEAMGAGLYGEGGYVVGGDGNGPVAGGGAIWSVFDGFAGVLVMYRASLVDGVRHDVTLNVEFAVPLHLLYQDD